MVYAFEMIDLFLDKDVTILSDIQYGIDGVEDVFEEVTLTDKELSPKEIYILVDEYTASSAEIVTYALNAHLDNVIIVGENTYGKGISTLSFDNYYGANITLLSSYFNMYNRDGTTTSYQDLGIPPELEYVWQDEEYNDDFTRLLSNMNNLIDSN
jgi:C-terminal processing protease CtpA/Prc